MGTWEHSTAQRRLLTLLPPPSYHPPLLSCTTSPPDDSAPSLPSPDLPSPHHEASPVLLLPRSSSPLPAPSPRLRPSPRHSRLELQTSQGPFPPLPQECRLEEPTQRTRPVRPRTRSLTTLPTMSTTSRLIRSMP